MEDNSLTPSPAPTPNPGTNMPEFATAPAVKPDPVVASAMPDFGLQKLADTINQVQPQHQSQPAQPQSQPQPQPAQPQPGTPTPAEMDTAINTQPQTTENSDSADDLSNFFGSLPTPASGEVAIAPEYQPNFDGISIDPSVNHSTSSINQPEPTKAQPEYLTNQSASVAGQPESNLSSPAPTIEQLAAAQNFQSAATGLSDVDLNQAKNIAASSLAPKKSNLKLIALISIAALIVVGGVVTAILLMNQPKPKINNPPTAPVQTTTINTSTPVAELTNSLALEFLEATADYETYYPESYAEEKVVDFLNDAKNITLLFSYADKSDVISDIKSTPAIANFKDRLTKDNTTVETKGDYSFVKIDQTAIKCGKNCFGLALDRSAVNFFADPTGIFHIVFTKNSTKDLKADAPLVASVFLNGKKVYSTELKVIDGITYYYVHTVEYADTEKTNASLKTFVFSFDPTTKEMLYRPDLEVNRALI